ncbi:MAG: MFS transporter [Acidimicrobiales bacterium]
MSRVPAAARVLPSTVFYGWYVALSCAVLLLVTVGVGYYGLAVFLGPLQERHGWSNTAVSGATGIYFAVGGATGALIGSYVDRNGPLRLQTIGVVLLAGSVSLVGFVEELWQLYLVYTVLAVGFGMSSSVAANAIIGRWFVARRARAMSISSTGVSVGGVILVPLATVLVARGGLELAGVVMALIVLALALPVVRLVLAWDPSDLGLRPDDGAALPSTTRAALDDSVQRRVWTRRQASSTLAFWAILVGFALVLMAQTGFIIHQISFLTERFGSETAAAAALSITALGSIIARLVVGVFADDWDKRHLTIVLFVVQACAVFGLVMVENRIATYGLVLVVGFTIGNIYMMQSLLVGETFGLVSFGTVFGLVGVATQVSSGLGPFAIGLIEDATGGYTAPFTVTAVTTLVAAVVVWFARPPMRSDAEPVTITSTPASQS